jgi:thiaminase/transcriptional activator TenA
LNVTVQPDYGQAFGRWRAACGPTWQAFTHHQFVRQLGDGSLPPDAFLHYLRQDYVFLIHFSRAWGLAIAKSETIEEMKGAAGTVDALVNHEIALHIRICAEHGLSEGDLAATEETTANLAYTRYVLEAGYSGDWLDLMAALAPCVMGYGEIGRRLISEATSSSYSPWIETYAGPEYQQACQAAGALIDAGVHLRLGENYVNSARWAILCQRFQTASRLEVGFWQMGLTPPD